MKYYKYLFDVSDIYLLNNGKREKHGLFVNGFVPASVTGESIENLIALIKAKLFADSRVYKNGISSIKLKTENMGLVELTEENGAFIQGFSWYKDSD